MIHQLAQAGRTLVAVILNCRNTDFRPLIASSIEGLRSCVGLLRRFSGRYLCGLRSADIIDEFCRSESLPAALQHTLTSQYAISLSTRPEFPMEQVDLVPHGFDLSESALPPRHRHLESAPPRPPPTRSSDRTSCLLNLNYWLDRHKSQLI